MGRRRGAWVALVTGVVALAVAGLRYSSREQMPVSTRVQTVVVQPPASVLFPLAPDDDWADNDAIFDPNVQPRKCAVGTEGPECKWCAPGHVGWPTCRPLTEAMEDKWALMDEHFAAARGDVDDSVDASLAPLRKVFRDARGSQAIRDMAEKMSEPTFVDLAIPGSTTSEMLRLSFEKVISPDVLHGTLKSTLLTFGDRCKSAEDRAIVASGQDVADIPDMEYEEADLTKAISAAFESIHREVELTQKDSKTAKLRETGLDISDVMSFLVPGKFGNAIPAVTSLATTFTWEQPQHLDRNGAMKLILDKLDTLERDLIDGRLAAGRSLDDLADLCLTDSDAKIRQAACEERATAPSMPMRVGLRRFMQNFARTRLEKYREAVRSVLLAYQKADTGARP